MKIESYSDLRRAFAQRRRELGLSQQAVNHLAGLQDGYVAKLECGVRNWGPLSLPMALAALDADLVLVPKAAEAHPQ